MGYSGIVVARQPIRNRRRFFQCPRSRPIPFLTETGEGEGGFVHQIRDMPRLNQAEAISLRPAAQPLYQVILFAHWALTAFSNRMPVRISSRALAPTPA